MKSRFYICQSAKCGYVKTALEYNRSLIPLYCPRCDFESYWRGPLSTKTHTLSGNRIKKTTP